MISRATIKALIDETEARYRKCWETLATLKRAESSPSAEFSEAMLDFQPTLARALFDLSKMHQALHQEKRRTVAKKARLSPKWFTHRLRTLDGYQQVIKTTTAIGKKLGDSFAWPFYEEERARLPEHYNHQGQPYVPSGLGGLGELKFIENHRVINGHLVLYHGITTFLRVGDVSLIDIRDGSLAALGELKTTKVAEGQLNITLDTVWPSKEGVLAFAGAGKERKDADDEPAPVQLSQRMRARLDRQVTSMSKSFILPNADRTVDLENDLHIDELEALCKELKTSAVTFRKVGDGYFLFGMRILKRSLASKLMGRYTFSTSEKLAGLTQEAQSIIRKGSLDNEWWVGSLNKLGSEYNLTPGMVPLFWWPLDLGVIEAILFQDVWLFSVYNPAHLAAKLRNVGFEVESLKGQRGLRVEKKLGNKTLCIEQFDYFTHLITGQFWKEEAVVEMLSTFADRVEREAVSPYTKIEMRIQQHLGPKPTGDHTSEH